MAKDKASWQFRIAVALAAACVVPVCANGQDSSEIQPILGRSAGPTAALMVDSAAAAGVFKARWAAPATEYVLDASGTLTQSPAPARFGRSTTQIDNVDSNRTGSTQQNHNTVLDHPEGDVSTSYPMPLDAVDADVLECGPSPLEPVGIKALVEETANRHGVDPGFALAIVATESDFNRDRNSPKGARGPMQLMPATADRFDVDDVCDPAANIEGGIKYLRTLLDEFGNPLLAAAAYNAGEQRIYEYGGIPPFAETVSYVAKVVNHQLGLAMPAAGKKARRSSTPDDEAPDVGVVAPKKTGTFVAGVMHF